MMVTMVGTVSQMLTSQHFYRKMYSLEDMDDMEFQKHMRKKLSTHLKNLFKQMITNE